MIEKNIKTVALKAVSASAEILKKEYYNFDRNSIKIKNQHEIITKFDLLSEQIIIKEIKKLYDSDTPIFAICLGHQLMALATGADTHKLKYGHRGGNHPVKDLKTNRVYISSQNHGYVVDTDMLDEKIAKPAFVNVNDETNEGLEYIGKNIFTVQFHPEACPGPQDSSYLFERFIEMMGGTQ